MDENQKLTYADKFADYEGQGIRPPTLEERAERKAKKEEEERRIAEKAKGIETYIPYVVRASSMEDEGEKYEVVKEMRKVHDEICRRLFDAGDESDLILVHVAAYDAARREILPPKSGSGKGRRMIRATNVYDDDDRPTTHYL